MSSDQTVHAVVLRRRDSGESDRRLTLLTAEQGLMEIIAKGAKRPGSRFSGSSEPLSAAIFHVALGKKNLFLTQAQPVSSFPGLRSDFDRLTFGLALAEVLAQITPPNQPAEATFRRTVESLKYLEVHPAPLASFLWSLVKFLQSSGFMPEWQRCAVCGREVEELKPAYSPHAGGLLHAACAERFTDRMFGPIEVAYTISKLADREEPPPNVKLAPECLRVLVPFWQAVTERPLPALKATLEQVSWKT